DLTKEARASNISFYPIAIWNPTPVSPVEMLVRRSPSGMAPPAGFQVPVRTSPRFAETLFDLAKATSVFAVPPMGNVTQGLSRIAGDVGSHYMLGYYTNNTKWDGKLRSIRVRLKPTGTEIH